MANDKLQELTRQLYEEGLSKGKSEGDKYLADAKAKSEKMIADARKEAEKIIAEANKAAEAQQKKLLSDMKMATSQALETFKSDIQNLIGAKAVDANVASAMAEDAFVKDIIKAVAASFSKDADSDLSVILPESVKGSALETYVANELAKVVGKSVEVQFSGKFKGGFTIGPKEGSYYISFTDDTLNSLIREYLRPSTRKLLFGESE